MITTNVLYRMVAIVAGASLGVAPTIGRGELTLFWCTSTSQGDDSSFPIMPLDMVGRAMYMLQQLEAVLNLKARRSTLEVHKLSRLVWSTLYRMCFSRINPIFHSCRNREAYFVLEYIIRYQNQ